MLDAFNLCQLLPPLKAEPVLILTLYNNNIIVQYLHLMIFMVCGM